MSELELEQQVRRLAAAGRYQTPECNYLAARLRYIKAEDPDEADRALADMLRHVTLTIPDQR